MERMRTVAYLRVSTNGQAEDGVSLDAQRAKVEAYAALYDLDLVAVVVDAGESGKTLNRPALREALGMLDDGDADALLVAKLDRLTRSVCDLGWLLDGYFGAESSHRFMSVAEQFDTRTAAGRMVMNVLASIFQWERETIAERTRDALAHLRAVGVVLGGEGLGWRRTGETDADGRRVVERVGHEAATVRRLLALRAEGLTLRAVADRLTGEGHKTKRGGRWHGSTVRAVLVREGKAA